MMADWHSKSMREALWVMVRRRVPERDAEDVLQSVLAEALASPHRPAEPESARRWIWGVARNKIADYHRRARREVLTDDETHASVDDESVRDLLQWAVGELPSGFDAKRTFEWLLREGEGEKLEEIARAERLPAAQVRQRVSRLRRHFRERWAAYAAVAGLLTVAAWFVWRQHDPNAPRLHAPMVQPLPDDVARLERAREIRREALLLCGQERWNACLERLDAARVLDPAGENVEAIRAARDRANRERRHETPIGPREPGMPPTAPPTTTAPNPFAPIDAHAPPSDAGVFDGRGTGISELSPDVLGSVSRPRRPRTRTRVPAVPHGSSDAPVVPYDSSSAPPPRHRSSSAPPPGFGGGSS